MVNEVSLRKIDFGCPQEETNIFTERVNNVVFFYIATLDFVIRFPVRCVRKMSRLHPFLVRAKLPSAHYIVYTLRQNIEMHAMERNPVQTLYTLHLKTKLNEQKN